MKTIAATNASDEQRTAFDDLMRKTDGEFLAFIINANREAIESIAEYLAIARGRFALQIRTLPGGNEVKFVYTDATP